MRIHIAFIASLVMLFTGCATIVGEKIELINIESEPNEAKVTISDEKGEEIFSGTKPTEVTLEKSTGRPLQVAMMKGYGFLGPGYHYHAQPVPGLLVAGVNRRENMEVKYKQIPDSYLDRLKGKPEKKRKFWIKDCFLCKVRQNMNLIYRTGKDLEVDVVITYTYTPEYPTSEITRYCPKLS